MLTFDEAVSTAEGRVCVLRQLFDVGASAIGAAALVPEDRDGALMFWSGLRDQMDALRAELEAIRAANARRVS